MYLVTGAAGFIGSALIQGLNTLQNTDRIIAVDKLGETSSWKNFNYLAFCDYIDADDLIKSPHLVDWSKIQGIFHLGACSSTTEKNVGFLLKNNFEYSKFLFTKAREWDIPFIYASSAATYGDGELGYDDCHSKLSKLRPLNPYGYSKQIFDLWVLKQEKCPTVWAGLKFFNVYGPNEYHKGPMISVVNQSFHQIKKEGASKLFKSYKKGFAHGEQLRDFIYVKDTVLAMIRMMKELKPKNSSIYNLGTGKARSFNDLARATFKALNIQENIQYIEMPESIRDQYQYFTEAKMEKFHSLFPQFQFTTLEAGVHDYVTNYLEKSCPYLQGQ